MSEFPKLRLMGEQAILIEFAPVIDEEVLEKVLLLKQVLLQDKVKEKIEIIAAYNSLLVNYPEGIEDVYNEVSQLKFLLAQTKVAKKKERNIFHIPVCYDGKFALDLDQLAQSKNMKKAELISLHTRPVYTVFFIGFLPGFLYLGGLDERLRSPRHEEPRFKVRKGAVGIGGNQTGIYPSESPGGWQIIGNSPVPLFDKNAIPPCEISAGDKIRFYSIGANKHQEILEQVKEGNFSFKKEVYG